TGQSSPSREKSRSSSSLSSSFNVELKLPFWPETSQTNSQPGETPLPLIRLLSGEEALKRSAGESLRTTKPIAPNISVPASPSKAGSGECRLDPERFSSQSGPRGVKNPRDRSTA